MYNRLSGSSNPYLRQHAGNPVHWQPWDAESVQQAEDSGKLRIVSIGYAACHWCHVMEHESFANEQTAEIMNLHYINIKIDREERPDLDQYYMTAAQLITGQGGWPLNAITLPDGRPVFAGTYFPREKWERILEHFAHIWKTDPAALEEQANDIDQGRKGWFRLDDAADALPDVQAMVNTILDQCDVKWGGLDKSPKFPMPVIWDFLLETESQHAAAFPQVERTLLQMASGGIYDHLGGGFARYSTDVYWFAPHFEKMLYDNAQLLSLYARAYKKNQNPAFLKIAHSIVFFLEEELLYSDSKGIGFYSALDADSEGEEGKFYTWEKKEIDLLTGDFSEIFCTYYAIRPEGNWEGRNILAVGKSVRTISQETGIPENRLSADIQAAKKLLYAHRKKRIYPSLDDKILTSWNALLICGLLELYRASQQEVYLEKAAKIWTFLEFYLCREKIYHAYREKVSDTPAFLEDYATVIAALLQLGSATGKSAYIHQAHTYYTQAVSLFYSEEEQLFALSDTEAVAGMGKQFETQDNVIPCGNSIMACNMLILYELGLLPEGKAHVENSLLRLKNSMEKYAPYYSNWGKATAWIELGLPVIVGIGPDARQEMRKIDTAYVRSTFTWFSDAPSEELPVLAGKGKPGETRLYWCEKQSCREFPF